MENTDAQPKQAAWDNKFALAGNGSRKRGVGIDDMGERA